MTIFSSNINQLNPKINLFLEELDTIAWFKNVGKSIHSQEVKQLFSWDDAWSHLQNENWINASFHNHIDSMNPVSGYCLSYILHL